MKLKDLKAEFNYYSEQASKLCRQFAMIGIGVIWIFTFNEKTSELLLGELIIPMITLVGSLLFDLSHYLYGSIAWGIARKVKYDSKLKELETIKEGELSQKQKKEIEEETVSISNFINWPNYFFYYSKFICLGIGYFLLMKFMVSTIPL